MVVKVHIEGRNSRAHPWKRNVCACQVTPVRAHISQAKRVKGASSVAFHCESLCLRAFCPVQIIQLSS